MRSALLRKYSENLEQLEGIIELQEQFNSICARQPLEARMSFDDIEKFLALTKAAYDQIKSSPSWKVFLKYPQYWHLAEAHARYFAPSQARLQNAITELGQSAAHGTMP